MSEYELEQLVSLEDEEDVCYVCHEKENIVSVCDGCSAMGHIKCIEEQLKVSDSDFKDKCGICKKEFDVVEKHKFQGKKFFTFLFYFLTDNLYIILNLYLYFLKIDDKFFDKKTGQSSGLIGFIFYVTYGILKNVYNYYYFISDEAFYVNGVHINKKIKRMYFVPLGYLLLSVIEIIVGNFVYFSYKHVIARSNLYKIIFMLHYGAFLMFVLFTIVGVIALIVFSIKRSDYNFREIFSCFFESFLTIEKEEEVLPL